MIFTQAICVNRLNEDCITLIILLAYPDSKVHGANVGPIWGRQDPGGPHVGHMNLAILVYIRLFASAISPIYGLVANDAKYWHNGDFCFNTIS